MLAKILKLFLGTHNERVLKKIYPIINKINQLEPKFSNYTDEQLKAMTSIFKERLAKGEKLDDILPEAFAVVREVSKRTLGLRPFDVQLIGGVVLHWGNIAEMKTGEGKTLVATLPVYLNALTGKSVHIVTVNDYLAKRDAEWMGPIYKFLGLTVGYLQNMMSTEDRKKVYQCDVVYGTNSEFGFDYLRDNMVYHKDMKVQRGHYYCIVDEVDSVLIDEARTPLIISGPTEDNVDKYYIADKVVPRLKPAQKGPDGKWIPGSGDYQLEEKEKSVVLTEEGIGKVEEIFGINDLYKGKNIELVHCIHQALRAHKLFKRDKDYMVKNGEVIIIDENTGRPLEGRRYSDGLHQAIEAKERVTIRRENQTLATITIQNYFKMYEKLAGMTGTAETEAEEFMKIYGMDVIVIPPNKPVIRIDAPDLIYKNKKAKYEAITEEIVNLHKKGVPVLLGTIAVETSEHLSKLLSKKKIPHNVLNAKQHEKEAEIIAQAGQVGKVTIATNMAGRGTDIVLGGNPTFQAEKYLENIIDRKWIKEVPVQMYIKNIFDNKLNIAFSYIEPISELAQLKEEKVVNYLQRLYANWKEENKKVIKLGGLHVIGSERHEARRIDNQLRGRSGRQGDPGYSRFYLSLEDDLMRLFGSDRILPWLERAGFKENEPIEHKWVTKSIEKAQKRVEMRNFEIRKHLLEYDEVMNNQRTKIYNIRDKVLFNDDIKAEIITMIKEFVFEEARYYSGGGKRLEKSNLNEFLNRIYQVFGVNIKLEGSYFIEEAVDSVINRLISFYEKKESEVGSNILREIERIVLLQIIDSKWKRHLYVIDELQEGIGLRSYGEKNPLVEYKIEASNLFDQMLQSLKEDVLHILFTSKIERKVRFEDEFGNSSIKTSEERGELLKVGVKKKIGRNEPCPCGSGKKYKNCCGK
ncbi:MAG TPA: preprotein translocase subunit SecA [Spirochaetota bacterium]|mgnify:CR=1 FL=1|nr:preprotein translocase subunit SecA [Spirochaetota bacterium]HOM38590.1 preprotein translocase subunit SecA [Spirochaetota bacterium]HPQ49727.1 preprotein translocase subunit SecA [Spirochaetota bacterium]